MGLMNFLLHYKCRSCGSHNTRNSRNAEHYTSFVCEECDTVGVKLDFDPRCCDCGSTSFSLGRHRFSGETRELWTMRCNGCGNWIL